LESLIQVHIISLSDQYTWLQL